MMMAAARADKTELFALHRLGIAAHVFIDTFAHQGFVGLYHDLNTATEIMDEGGKALPTFPVPPVGHGQVGTYPDFPFLRWSYVDWEGKKVTRDNPADFLAASHRLCQEFQLFLGATPTGMSDEQKEKVSTCIASFKDESGKKRHARWLEKIASGYFGFDAAPLEYTGKAVWKPAALGVGYERWKLTAEDKAREHVTENGHDWLHKIVAVFSGKAERSIGEKTASLAEFFGSDAPIECDSPDNFLGSDYKKFHDAAKAQRFDMLALILPKFGIYAN